MRARRTATAAIAFAMVCCVGGCGPDLQPYATCNSDKDPGEEVVLPPLAAELLVPNIDIGVEWYRDLAGFTLLFNDADEQSCFAELELEGGHVLLSHSARAFDPPDDAIELRFMVADVDAVNERLKSRGATYVREILDEEYGLRDFVVRDVYGFRVRFATPRRPRTP